MYLIFTFSVCLPLIYSKLPDFDHHHVGAGWHYHHYHSCLLLLLLQVRKNWVSIKSHEVLAVKSDSKWKEEEVGEHNGLFFHKARLIPLSLKACQNL